MARTLIAEDQGALRSALAVALREAGYDVGQNASPEEFLRAVEEALQRGEPAPEISTTIDLLDTDAFRHIIGRSQAMRDVLSRIIRIAPTDATVLITGESGTGKEVVARAIHANSKRADRPFVAISCATIAETPLVVEEAGGGTVFFDDIAETPLSLQAKLLHAIEGDIRLIAATNQDLGTLIEEKRFREDLYYRLNVARIVLPPLRQRRDDIAPLADHFLEQHVTRLGRYVQLGDGVMDFFMRYDFPGNIRELENLLEQGVALAANGHIELDDIVPLDLNGKRPSEIRSLQDAVDQAERETILRTLEDVGGNKERAAERLGLSHTTLWRKMKRLELAWPESA